jgi:hypothetical protein
MLTIAFYTNCNHLLSLRATGPALRDQNSDADSFSRYMNDVGASSNRAALCLASLGRAGEAVSLHFGRRSLARQAPHVPAVADGPFLAQIADGA